MKVEILGTGCPRCQTLEKNVREALLELGSDARVVKISDMDDIMEYGVMMTPALGVNGILKSSGKVLTKEQIVELLKSEK